MKRQLQEMLHKCILCVLLCCCTVIAQDVACTAHIPLGTGARHYFDGPLDPAKPYISLAFITGDDPLLTARGFCALYITGNGSPFECVDQIMHGWEFRANACPFAIEGNTGLFSSSPMTLLKAAQQVPLDGTICEIGFNAGHSAIAYLSANPKARIISFDIGHHSYTWKALQVLQHFYPDASLQLVIGDSARSIPDFIKLNPHIRCDLIFIDGGHEYAQAMADLKNMKALANTQGHVLIIDDVSTIGTVQQAWSQSLQDGLIEASTELDDLLLPANAQRHSYVQVFAGTAADTVRVPNSFTAMAIARYKFEAVTQ
eukprot:1589-Heterococcus_DN1.PRE.3